MERVDGTCLERSPAVIEPLVAASFTADSAVRSQGAGRYAARTHHAWSGPPGPNGGYVAALLLRAIRAEVPEPERLPRSLTVHFLRPPAIGAIEIEVTVERSGRNASTCSARMTQEGRTMCLALCVLTGSYEAVAEFAEPSPAVRPPDELRAISTDEMRPAIFNQHEFRPAFGERPFVGADEGVVGGWVRTRLPEPLEPELLAMYSDVWWPAAFPRLDEPAMMPTLELTIHFRAAPPPGAHPHVLCRFTSRTSAGGFVEEDGELWSEAGVLLAQSRQLALLRPIPDGAGGGAGD